MKNFNITATATNEELYLAAEIACSIALRTLYSRTGLQLYNNLINQYYNDKAARAAAQLEDEYRTAEIAENIRLRDEAAAMTAATGATADARTAREHARSMAHTAAQIAARLTITEEDRAAAEEEADAWEAVADGYREDAEQADRANRDRTFSDRADMTQAAAIAIFQTWTEPAEVTDSRRAHYAAAIGKKPDEELTEEEEADLQTAANFRAAINAARMESTRLAHPDAMNGTNTKLTKATEEDAQAWADTFGGTGADIRRPASRKNTKATDCYDTMEYRTGKRVNGWYLVRHYKTIRPYDSYELATEESGNEPTAAELGNDEAAAERARAIVSRANLTPTERTALVYYCISLTEAPTEHQTQTAAKVTEAAEAARVDYLTERAAAIAKLDKNRQPEAIARAQATAANKAERARWKAALTEAGYSNDKKRQRAQAAIISALLGAAEHPENIYYRGTEPKRRPDMIAAVAEAAADISAVPVIAWRDSRILYAAAPCVTGWRGRYAKSARASAAVIENLKRTKIDNSTPEARAKAEAAAEAYTQKHAQTVKAKAATVAADTAADMANAEQTARARRAAAARQFDSMPWRDNAVSHDGRGTRNFIFRTR